MATLYVSYFSFEEKKVASGLVGSTTITTSGTSAATADVIPDSAGIVAVHSDAAHYVTIGNDPTATATNGVYVPANATREIAVSPVNKDLKVAAITV